MAEGYSAMSYLSCTSRKISSLWDLKPGDHIRVGEFITHHMLVVAVVDNSQVRVIHQTGHGVEEESVVCKPDDITVLDYECSYTGKKAIQRARERVTQLYSLVFSNCEHFVTEVKTGEKLSIQVQNAVKVGIGVAVGVGIMAAAGAGLLYAL